MKDVIFGVISILVVCLIACDQPSSTTNTIVNTSMQKNHLVTDTKRSDSLPHMDTSVMIIDSMSHITFNGMPLNNKHNGVYRTVYDSWLQAYHKTNHLPVAFKLVQQGTVTMGIRGDVGDALLQVQNDLKNYIAKDKYKKPFSQLSPDKKDSMQMLHPILFKRPF